MAKNQQPTLPLGGETLDLLADLNEQQRQAVTHPAGPLLIIAGAGTGKTKTLTHRIAWLVSEGKAKPSEILALTFTDKAAGEMEARVDELLPYGQTDATIATFHAFGDQLLREHALDLGLPPEFQVLGSTEQELFLAERFDEIEGLVELRPVGSPRKFIAPILSVISRAKDELVTPGQYAVTAQSLLDRAQDDDDRREAQRQCDIATIYTAYESFKAEKGVIDFGDQILFLHQYLSSHPKLLRSVRDRYRYILVDEFQDTNVAQYTLVKLLLGDEQNLTVVGDDDQAIYKFRGAAVSNILGFLKDFPNATQVVLTQNYRSTQGILDAAHQLITHNNPDRLEVRLSIDKQLTGQVPGSQPTIRWYYHEADELDGLVAQVNSQLSTVKPSDIAILVRSNNLVGSISQALTKADIPFTASRDVGFIDRPEIRGIIAFFQVLVHPTNSLAYVKLATSPYYRHSADWILPVNDAAKRANRSIHDVLADGDSVAWTRLPSEGKQAVAQLRDDLARYRSMIATRNPGEILYHFLKDRGLLDRTTDASNQQAGLFTDLPDQERLVMIQNVAAVFDAISGYISSGRDSFTLSFVDELDELLATVTPPSTNVGPDQDAVTVATIHAAKGLEWPIVYLPSLMADRFPARRRTQFLELPGELIAEELPSGDEHLQEERRLMYVAMTRAKQELNLSGSERVGSGTRTKKISPFVVEALNLTSISNPLQRVSHVDRLQTFAPTKPIEPTIGYPGVGHSLFLSPAAIDAYVRDPYDFFWKYVLKAPQLPSRHLVYGNAIHSAIEAYYHARRSISSEEKDGKMVDVALDRFAAAWQSEGFESQADENRQFEHGQETVRRFISRAQTEALPELVEHSFSLNLPGVRIKGRMDAVFRSTGEIRDFKTSQVKDQKDANKKLRDNVPIRIYALAYHHQFGELPQSLVLDFVEHDLKASLEPTEGLLEETKQLIAEVVAGISAGRYEPNPSNPFHDYDLS